MNWLDVVFMIAVLWLTFAGFQAGFIRETVTLVSGLIGVALAGLFYQDLADSVFSFIDSDDLRSIVAFGSIFLGCALAGQALAMVLKPSLRMIQLGIVDQLGGAGFGFLKALLFINIFVLVFITYPRWDLYEAIDESFFGALIVENVSFIDRILPAEFDIAVDNFNGDGEELTG
jgi:membrane protein required for colicin V production